MMCRDRIRMPDTYWVAGRLLREGTHRMRIFRNFVPGPARLAAVLFLVLSASVVSVGLALAGHGGGADDSCDLGDACWYKHSGFEVPLRAEPGSNINYRDGDVYPNTQQGFNDSVSSASNDGTSGWAVYAYSKKEYGNLMFCLKKDHQVSSYSGSWNDRQSSHRWLSNTSGCL